MSIVQTLIGNVKGPQGERGLQGEQGTQGEAATIEVGTVTTVPYGQTASVVNSGTESEAVFDFTIPQGRPGEQVTDMQNLTLGAITTSAAEFPIPAVGETGKVIFGKITKWFSDMTALVATKLNVANVVNNLTTTSPGYALDARQGEVLNDTKLNVANVVNNLTTTSPGYALDARQGEVLNDTKLNVANVVNNVTTSEEGYALDARVGKSMNDYMRAHYDSSYVLALPSGTTGALLDTINTLKTQSKEMPFCIQKAGFASVSDLPPNITATEEFQVLVFGSTVRWTVILARFSSQSSGAIFLRNGWRDGWLGGWGQINVSSVS